MLPSFRSSSADSPKYLPMSSFRRVRASAGIASREVMMAVASAEPHLQVRSSGHGRHRFPHHVAGVLGVLVEHGDDLLHRNLVVSWMPAVVIGDHGDGGVANLRLARQLGLLQVGHADHVHAPAAVEIALGLGGELRTFHANVGSAQLADYAGVACSPWPPPWPRPCKPGRRRPTCATMPSPKKVETRCLVRS